jgi:hypothetical protein
VSEREGAGAAGRSGGRGKLTGGARPSAAPGGGRRGGGGKDRVDGLGRIARAGSRAEKRGKKGGAAGLVARAGGQAAHQGVRG